jgi:hypothetical protein
MAFSPQANYTDWATATGWRILVPNFADRGVSRDQRGGTHAEVNLSFLDRNRYVFFLMRLINQNKLDKIFPDNFHNKTYELPTCHNQ